MNRPAAPSGDGIPPHITDSLPAAETNRPTDGAGPDTPPVPDAPQTGGSRSTGKRSTGKKLTEAGLFRSDAPSTTGARQGALRRVRVYGTYLRLGFLAMLAYRMRYVTGILTYLLFVSVNYFIWTALFSGRMPGQRLQGFTLAEMITYVAVGWIARSFYFSNIDESIDELIREGDISNLLMRPVHFHYVMLSKAIGESLFRAIFFSAPISLVILTLFPVSLPASPAAGMQFLLSVLLAFFVLAEINFVTGLLAFRLQSTQGVMRAKYYVTQLFSGLLLPLSFFPPAFRLVLDLLPFRAIGYVPLKLYLGHLQGSAAALALGEQLAWAIVLFLLAELCWGRAVRHLTVQGG